MVSRRAFLLPSLVLPFSAACVNIHGADSGWIAEREEKRFKVDGRPELLLSTFDGSIEIKSWDRPEVLVVIEKRAVNQEAAAAVDVESEQQGNRIRVEAKHPGARVWGWFGGGSARLIVSVPENSDVRASSGDGSIRLDRVSGRIVLHSGDGGIEAMNSSGNVSASTGDGSIDLSGIQGDVEASTGDGRVRVAGKLTRVRARSGDGSITIQAESGSAAESDWDITSGDGSVTLFIPERFDANLDARTGDGGIHLDGVSVTGSVQSSRRQITGQLGDGGRAVRVRTGDGSIRLRRS